MARRRWCSARWIRLKNPAKPPVLIAGFGQATDTHTLQERDDPTDLKAVTLAAQQAFEMAKLKPSDIHVAELHDAFTILEIAESEHVGFFKKGEGGKAALAGKTRLGGQIPINVSGGLKARGHPVGATGVAQVVRYRLAAAPRAAQGPPGEERPERPDGQLWRVWQQRAGLRAAEGRAMKTRSASSLTSARSAASCITPSTTAAWPARGASSRRSSRRARPGC